MRHPLDYSRARRLVGSALRNRRAQLRWLPAACYLNLGCGGNVHHPGFVNMDWSWRRGIHLCWDVTRGIPVEDGRFDGVFTEHTLEHFPLGTGRAVLDECWRVLAPGGVLRVVVPDGGQLLDDYQAGVVPDRPRGDGLRWTPMMRVNNSFYKGHDRHAYGHHFIYDHDTLRVVLEAVGFVKVERAQFGEGRIPGLLIDSEKRRPGSLYVEATKPG